MTGTGCTQPWFRRKIRWFVRREGMMSRFCRTTRCATTSSRLTTTSDSRCGEHNQIYYDIWTTGEKKEFKFIFPRCYTQRIQKNGNSYHFPCGKIEENMKYIQKYLCLVDTKPSSGGCLVFYLVCCNNDVKGRRFPSGAICEGVCRALSDFQ